MERAENLCNNVTTAKKITMAILTKNRFANTKVFQIAGKPLLSNKGFLVKNNNDIKIKDEFVKMQSCLICLTLPTKTLQKMHQVTSDYSMRS